MSTTWMPRYRPCTSSTIAPDSASPLKPPLRGKIDLGLVQQSHGIGADESPCIRRSLMPTRFEEIRNTCDLWAILNELLIILVQYTVKVISDDIWHIDIDLENPWTTATSTSDIAGSIVFPSTTLFLLPSFSLIGWFNETWILSR